MDFLHDHGVSGFEPELHNIDLSGRAEDLPHKLPDITGDRAIVGTMAPEHYVAFRKDEAGDWWKLDSVGGARPEKMSPEDYVGRDLTLADQALDQGDVDPTARPTLAAADDPDVAVCEREECS
jgi:hypothetical protein